jgi:hypothetical protein
LHSKIRTRSLKGLNLTHKNNNRNETIPSGNLLLELVSKPNIKSTSCIKPKKKFELVNPSKLKID